MILSTSVAADVKFVLLHDPRTQVHVNIKCLCAYV
jgi:hypothetical protein